MAIRSFFLVLLSCVYLACSGASRPAVHRFGPPPPESSTTGSPDANAAPGTPPPLLTPDEWRPPTASGSAPLLIHTSPGDLPRLELADDTKSRLTLEHTHVSARLTGFVAEVEVSQTYTNPFKRPIEAIYVFPLPENSAVHHMRIVIDKRVIEAAVKERSEARRTYETAKARGHTTALLEQERPNVFTQSVANIEPGKKIDVVVRYLQDLSYDAGSYEFVFPMVVGPRFMPGAVLEGPSSGSGTHADTTEVPDASRISPPYVGKGQRTGRDISLELVADAGVALTSFDVPTHEVSARRPADGTLRMTLAEKSSIPNRDFVLRYRVAKPEPQAALFLGAKSAKSGATSKDEGFFSLVVWPPELDVESLVGRRELVFVVDVSGSMSGVPISMCQSAMRTALRRLRPVDTFNILTFSGATRRAFETSRPANSENVREALAVVSGLRAGGGTHMADAVAAALATDGDPERHRYVFFLTDGYVGNEDAIIASAGRFVDERGRNGHRARVFAFGVGSSVNRHLIDGLSRAGNGLSVYATTREDPSMAVNRFFHYIDRAVLEKLEIDWGGLEVEQQMPSPLPDLFASHAVTVHGRYSGKPSGKLLVRGSAQGKAFEIPVKFEASPPELAGARVLGTLWAREKITFLEEELGLGNSAVRDQIKDLGLEFHLVTRFTSLVAVDETRRVGDGNPDRVIEAVDEPEDVDVDMAGGRWATRQYSASSRDYGYSYEESYEESEAPAEAKVWSGQVSKVEQRRGCGCRTVGGSDESPWAAGIVALVAGLGFFRRRRVNRA